MAHRPASTKVPRPKSRKVSPVPLLSSVCPSPQRRFRDRSRGRCIGRVWRDGRRDRPQRRFRDRSRGRLLLAQTCSCQILSPQRRFRDRSRGRFGRCLRGCCRSPLNEGSATEVAEGSPNLDVYAARLTSPQRRFRDRSRGRLRLYRRNPDERRHPSTKVPRPKSRKADTAEPPERNSMFPQRRFRDRSRGRSACRGSDDGRDRPPLNEGSATEVAEGLAASTTFSTITARPQRRFRDRSRGRLERRHPAFFHFHPQRRFRDRSRGRRMLRSSCSAMRLRPQRRFRDRSRGRAKSRSQSTETDHPQRRFRDRSRGRSQPRTGSTPRSWTLNEGSATEVAEGWREVGGGLVFVPSTKVPRPKSRKAVTRSCRALMPFAVPQRRFRDRSRGRFILTHIESAYYQPSTKVPRPKSRKVQQQLGVTGAPYGPQRRFRDRSRGRSDGSLVCLVANASSLNEGSATEVAEGRGQ